MKKTNELLPNTNEPQKTSSNFASRPRKHTKPDIQKQCLICDSNFVVKYNLVRQRYSQKNNWGYWTDKETDQHKYLCNNCLVKILASKKFDAFDWISANKAANFRSYLARGDFAKKH